MVFSCYRINYGRSPKYLRCARASINPRTILVEQLLHPNGFRTNKAWEERSLLSFIRQQDDNGNALKSHIYSLNNLRQRDTIDREDGTELSFTYDQQRQVTDGERTTAGTQFPVYDYGFKSVIGKPPLAAPASPIPKTPTPPSSPIIKTNTPTSPPR